MLIDPHAVRPGTSAALTARTIDATIHPPLVRAQETVAALIPRVAAPLGSPVLISMLAATLFLLWVATRVRFRPGALVLSALCVLTLTSFHPVPVAQAAAAAEDSWPDNSYRGRVERFNPAPMVMPEISDMPPMPDEMQYNEPPQVPEPPSIDEVTPTPDQTVEPVEPIVDFNDQDLPPTPRVYPVPATPGVSVRISAPLEMTARERAQLEAAIAELRIRVRDELRRQERRRYY